MPIDWSSVLREQALSCDEISNRIGKSRPTTLKLLQEAVINSILDARVKDSIVFYSLAYKPECGECETAMESECSKCFTAVSNTRKVL